MAKKTAGQRLAELYITKLEAARRQIDAAIRMVFDNEDELAVHTVASAGYRILRDLLQKKGKYDVEESWRGEILAIVKDIAEGRTDFQQLDELGGLYNKISNN